VSENDVDAEVARLAERVGQKPAQLRKALERAEQMPAVRSDIRKSQALEWLVQHVEVVDEEGHAIDRADLGPPPETQSAATPDQEHEHHHHQVETEGA
jgi:trigger factor